MVQNLYKNWLQISKIIWVIWITSDKQWKVQNVELHLSKSYIPSSKTLYREDLSNITFNYLCENSLNSLCHFETISHFLRHNSSIYYFISDFTYFWQKCPIKVQIYRFFTAWVKIHQVSHVIFQRKSEFFFKNSITLQSHER